MSDQKFSVEEILKEYQSEETTQPKKDTPSGKLETQKLLNHAAGRRNVPPSTEASAEAYSYVSSRTRQRTPYSPYRSEMAANINQIKQQRYARRTDVEESRTAAFQTLELMRPKVSFVQSPAIRSQTTSIPKSDHISGYDGAVLLESPDQAQKEKGSESPAYQPAIQEMQDSTRAKEKKRAKTDSKAKRRTEQTYQKESPAEPDPAWRKAKTQTFPAITPTVTLQETLRAAQEAVAKNEQTARAAFAASEQRQQKRNVFSHAWETLITSPAKQQEQQKKEAASRNSVSERKRSSWFRPAANVPQYPEPAEIYRTEEPTLQSAPQTNSFSRESSMPPLKGEGDRRQAVVGSSPIQEHPSNNTTDTFSTRETESVAFSEEPTLQSAPQTNPFSRESRMPPLKGEGDRRQAVVGSSPQPETPQTSYAPPVQEISSDDNADNFSFREETSAPSFSGESTPQSVSQTAPLSREPIPQTASGGTPSLSGESNMPEENRRQAMQPDDTSVSDANNAAPQEVTEVPKKKRKKKPKKEKVPRQKKERKPKKQKALPKPKPEPIEPPEIEPEASAWSAPEESIAAAVLTEEPATTATDWQPEAAPAPEPEWIPEPELEPEEESPVEFESESEPDEQPELESNSYTKKFRKVMGQESAYTDPERKKRERKPKREKTPKVKVQKPIPPEPKPIPNREAEIRVNINLLRNTVFFRTIALIVLTAIEGFLAIGESKHTLLYPALSSLMTVRGYCIIHLILGLAILLISYPTIINGLKKFIHRESDADSIAALPFFPCFATILAVILFPVPMERNLVHIFMPVSSLILLMNSVGKLFIIRRATRNFALLTKNFEKYILTCVQNEASAETLTRGVVQDYPVLATIRKTEQMSDFLRHTYASDLADRFCRKLAPIVTGISLLLAAAITGIRIGVLDTPAENIPFFFSVWTMLLTAGCSAGIPLTVNLPLDRATKQLCPHGCTLLGYQSVDNFFDVNSVLLPASTLFPKDSVKIRAMKAFTGFQMEEALLDAASLVDTADSILQNAFAELVEEQTGMLYQVESCSYEDGLGLCGWIRHRRVLLGNREMMNAHNIEGMPTKVRELEWSEDGKEVLYLSVSGVLAAMFIITISADPMVKRQMRRLKEEQIRVVLRSVDSCLTLPRLTALFGVPESMLKILPNADVDLFEQETAPLPDVSAATIHDGSFFGTARLLLEARSIRRAATAGLLLQLVAIILGLSICIGYIFVNGYDNLTSQTLMTFQLVMTGLTVLAARLK